MSDHQLESNYQLVIRQASELSTNFYQTGDYSPIIGGPY